ncbi:RWP-RK domain [Plasmopara halstedii]|uniref:RWP-RK domain n=1 Tax=Plasmopara halstedii TaxID=4781 RepID=A0A0P1AVB9_PLAHL|nr:RWP-RK domain [Plasmopara halstedii]CEG46321.1 RWP-RK domain [Plasmopara halstedii]|eukprot:XP_024582690.1 RWP-RK domain [Plasmopara halstedii]
METELPATPTPIDSRCINLNFQSPTADKAQHTLRMQVATHNFKKRAACDSPVASDDSASPLPVTSCNFTALSRHFHLPLKVAAEKFGVRATAFKKRCRAIGIRHWPYRKVRSLKRSLQELEQCQQQAQDGSGPPLSEKQLRQFAGYQSQLKRLLSPETYGIDPFGQLLPAHFFHSDVADESNTPDDHDSDEDSCGSQSPRPSVEHLVRRTKARKHLFTDSPSSTSSPHRENMFFGNPMNLSAAVGYSRAQYGQTGLTSAQVGFTFDSMYDPFGELSTSNMDSYGENDHPSCGYSLDIVSCDFFPLQPSPTMAARKASAMAQQAFASCHTKSDEAYAAIAPTGVDGLEDDIFRHISPEYGCLV